LVNIAFDEDCQTQFQVNRHIIKKKNLKLLPY